MSKHMAKAALMATAALAGIGCTPGLESATLRGRTLALDGETSLMEPAPAPSGAHVYVAWMLPDDDQAEEEARTDLVLGVGWVTRSVAFDHGFAGTTMDPTAFTAEGIQPPPDEAIGFWGNAMGVIAVAEPSCAEERFIGAVDHSCARVADELLVYHAERGQQPELEFVHRCRGLAEPILVTENGAVVDEVSETDCVDAPADSAVVLEPGFNLFGRTVEERKLIDDNFAYDDACFRGANGDPGLMQLCYDRRYQRAPDPMAHLLPLDTEVRIEVRSRGDEE